MRSLQTRLLQSFLAIITIFIVIMGSIYWLNTYLVNQYKSVSTSMIAGYQLTETVNTLITAYNNRFLSSNISETSANKQISDAKSKINDLITQIDGLLVDDKSFASFTGLKNTINDVVNEVDIGVASLNAGDFSTASSHYAVANKKYTYVTQNSSTFLFDQLQYSVALQDRTNNSYKTLTIGAIPIIIISIFGSVFYAYRFSRKLVLPLSELTTVASAISRGNSDAIVRPELEKHTDEVGSLARSFSRMLRTLRGYIEQLNEDKLSIEQKVAERTTELEQEKARLAASVNSLSLGFIMTDATGNLLTINSPASTALSYSVDVDGISTMNKEIKKQEWSIDAISQRLKDHFDLKHEILITLESNVTYVRKEIDFNGRTLRLFLAPIINSDKTILGTVILIEDITEEKVLQRSRDEFFSIASHELRTPLTAIRGNSGMIEQFFGEQIKDNEFHVMLSDIHESSIRLISIVNDFLDASRLEQDKVTLKNEAFPVVDIVKSVSNDMNMLAAEKQNQIIVDTSLETANNVMADKDRVKQIVYNLIGNAMKFTEKGSITIRSEQVEHLLKIYIEDTGTGIPEEGQKLLFHKFQQASNSLYTRDSSKGTGLGLYISKLLAEKMGGRINLESSHPGKGTVFSFTIPVANKQ